MFRLAPKAQLTWDKVGISIAQAIDNAEVLMTDLLEASEIVDRNIRHAKTAPGSTMRFLELNWDEELPRDLYSHSDDRSVFDVIVAADCTYNSDSRSVSPLIYCRSFLKFSTFSILTQQQQPCAGRHPGSSCRNCPRVSYHDCDEEAALK
jgi:hypothetical protein